MVPSIGIDVTPSSGDADVIPLIVSDKAYIDKEVVMIGIMSWYCMQHHLLHSIKLCLR